MRRRKGGERSEGEQCLIDREKWEQGARAAKETEKKFATKNEGAFETKISDRFLSVSNCDVFQIPTSIWDWDNYFGLKSIFFYVQFFSVGKSSVN